MGNSGDDFGRQLRNVLLKLDDLVLSSNDNDSLIAQVFKVG